MPSRTVRAAKVSRCDFSSAFLILLVPLAYGVAEGEAEGEADSSAAAFFFAVFFGDADGDASVEADVEVFLVEDFLVVAVPWVVAVVEVALVASSFFAHEPRNAAIVSAVIKAKNDVFIGLVKLNEGRECRVAWARARLKMSFPNRDFLGSNHLHERSHSLGRNFRWRSDVYLEFHRARFTAAGRNGNSRNAE
jgi:hypothetical protein